LTGAMAWEEDGETTIFFRKKLEANGPTDHTIVEGDMHFIWAVGQENGMYSHSPASGLEAGEASILDFYRPDELKYHGKKNRGTSVINFFKEDKRDLNDVSDLDYCGNEWKFPTSCSLKDKTCEYFARWEYDENTDKINFTIVSKHTNKWTGIGFSATQSMSLTDAIIGWVEPNGRFFMMDMWTTNYLSPVLESRQNIDIISGEQEDGFTTLKFSRKRNTGDKQDVAFTDTEGQYIIFPVKGGRYNGVNKRIRKHELTPVASGEKIFIRSCRNADGKPTYTVTTPPPQLVYNAKMKFINLADNYQLPKVGTREYTDLENKISRSLSETSLKNVPGFEGVIISRLFSDNQGEFISDLRVVVDQDKYTEKEDDLTVEDALQKTVGEGRVGRLYVDPESLTMGEARSTVQDQNESVRQGAEPNIKLYVVVACIAALVLVAVMQASCTIYKLTRRGTSVHKEKLLSQSQWKDYVSQPPPYHHNHGHDVFDHDDPKAWGPSARHHHAAQHHHHHHPDARHGGGGGGRVNTHSLPRGSHTMHGGGGGPPAASQAGYPMGYSSYDRRAGGGGAGFHSRPHGPSEYPPDHYFMPSQRKYAGEELRVYVDYNK